MKIKEGFALKNVAGSWVVLPLAVKNLDFTGMLSLNETGRMLWLLLEEGVSREDMAKALTEEYEVSYERALADVDVFLDKLVQTGCVEL
ncbi:MAG: PqqD family protein [Clostridia bacterium]|nr:PqqD family protein [Clostridia bacterium]